MVTLPSLHKESRGEVAEPTLSGQTVSPDHSRKYHSNQAGCLTVLAGPSGVGKGTLLHRLLQQHPEIAVSISATTRKPRPGEIDGQHYYFLSPHQFKQMVDSGELLEWAEFAGNCYGTPKAPIEAAIARGQQVILEIELVGARQIRKSFPEAKQIFVMPPSADSLETRIRQRGQDSEEAIAQRLAQAQVELAAADEFDHHIINDDLEAALANLEAAIFASPA
jgi:guanylate kinase